MFEAQEGRPMFEAQEGPGPFLPRRPNVSSSPTTTTTNQRPTTTHLSFSSSGGSLGVLLLSWARVSSFYLQDFLLLPPLHSPHLSSPQRRLLPSATSQVEPESGRSEWVVVEAMAEDEAASAKKLFSASDVVGHASRKDCWVVIHGKVGQGARINRVDSISAFFFSRWRSDLAWFLDGWCILVLDWVWICKYFLLLFQVYDVTKFLEDHPGGEDVLLHASGQMRFRFLHSYQL